MTGCRYSLEPGDVIATNDAWMGTGHLFDINVMRPVFRNDRIAGYTMSITHLPDIGGLGFGAAATEIFHEGLRLPICKLVRAGRLDEPMLDVIRSNVRVPEQVFGDLMANITCNEVGARQLLEFMDEYALDDLAPLSAAIRGHSERAIRERIAALPDGIYEGAPDIEGIDDALRLACRAEVDGGGIKLDFAGTSPPVDRGINVPLCYTRAMACYAVKCLTVPGMPNNEGAVAPIRVSAPQDSILNAQPPCPTGGRHVMGHMVVPLVFRTLAGAVPGQVPDGLRHDEHRDVPGHQPRRTPDVHHLLLDRRVRCPSGSRRSGHHPGPVQHENRADRDVGIADRHYHRAQAAASRHGRTRRGARRSRSGD